MKHEHWIQLNVEEQENIVEMVQRRPITSTRRIAAYSVHYEHV